MVLSALGREGQIFDYITHPIHLHGHNFYVVHVEYGSYENGLFRNNTPDITCSDSLCTWANGTGPNFSRYLTNGQLSNTAIRKDTVIVPAGGYVVIVFQADNPGYWFMHCHMEVHQLEGMAVIIQEYSDNQQWPPPFGINNIGDFLWQDEPMTTEKPTTAGELQETGQPGQPGAGGLTPQSTNRRMIAFITALVVIAVLIATIVALVIALCCKLKKEGAPKHQDHELEELS